MTWIFSKALIEAYESSRSLLEPVEAYSPDTCSDGAPSAPLNVMPTRRRFWRNDKMMEFSRLSQFGMTYKPLTETRGEELLTLYLAGFRARTLAQQEKEQG